MGNCVPLARVTTDRPSVPSAPLNLRAQGVKSTESPRAGVQWDPPADDGGSRSFKGYKLEVSVGTGEERNWVVLLTVISGLHSWTRWPSPGKRGPTALGPRNSVDEGPPSEEVTILVPAIEAGPPRDLAVTLDGPKFKLAWKAPSNNGGAEITGYKIEASTDQETWHAVPDTVTTLHHSLSGPEPRGHLLLQSLGDHSAGTGAPSATASGQVSCAIWCATATLSDHSSDSQLSGLFAGGHLLRLDADAEQFHL